MEPQFVLHAQVVAGIHRSGPSRDGHALVPGRGALQHGLFAVFEPEDHAETLAGEHFHAMCQVKAVQQKVPDLQVAVAPGVQALGLQVETATEVAGLRHAQHRGGIGVAVVVQAVAATLPGEVPGALTNRKMTHRSDIIYVY